MIVVAIIGLLASIAIPSFVKARKETQKALCIENMRAVFHSSHLREIETGTLMRTTVGTSGVALRTTLLGEGYIRKRETFECPTSGVLDYDDYILVYRDDAVVSVRCSLYGSGAGGDHILP
jgi:hypothetical protein